MLVTMVRNLPRLNTGTNECAVYLDGPDHFNNVMMQEMDDVEKRSEGLKKGATTGVQIVNGTA